MNAWEALGNAQLRVAKYDQGDTLETEPWSAGIWVNESVGRGRFKEREAAQAWGATAEEAIERAIEKFKEEKS